TRHTLYAGALRDADPVANLLLLNEAVLRRGGSVHFCTVVTAALRPREDGSVAVQLANGGHPPPLLLRADGRVEETTARGTLIGALPQPRLVAQDLVLRPGDLLLLYTDGVTELRTEDPDEGLRRLHECLDGLAGRPADEVAAAVERSVGEAAGGEPRDDVAVLAIRAAP
ncbi:MAG TPA: PP2C family protein-serine/threonine phosphatase, partial [Capillimicrobium sp.]